MSGGALRAVAALLAGAALAACAGVAPPPAAPPPVAVDPPPVRDFERRTREHAEDAEHRGRLAQAADDWEILTLLRPAEAGYRARLDALRARIETAAAEHLQRARAAWKRGELDAASAQYLAVLALQPADPLAADALRAIERERNRRWLQGRAARASGIDAQDAP